MITFLNTLMHPENTFRIVVRGCQECPSNFSIGPRTIPDHLIYYLEEGELTLSVNGKRMILHKEQLFWMQPEEAHTIRLASTLRTKVHYFRFFLGDSATPLKFANAATFITPPTPSLLPLIQSMLPVHAPSEPFILPLMRCQLATLWIRVQECSEHRNDVTEGLQPHQRKQAIDFLRNNISERFSLRELARASGLHPDYFSRQFKKSFGMTPQEWTKRERIRLACDYLLESGLSVSQIANKLGYEDLYFFSKQFKQVTGKSPAYWRKEQ